MAEDEKPEFLPRLPPQSGTSPHLLVAAREQLTKVFDGLRKPIGSSMKGRDARLGRLISLKTRTGTVPCAELSTAADSRREVAREQKQGRRIVRVQAHSYFPSFSTFC